MKTLNINRLICLHNINAKTLFALERQMIKEYQELTLELKFNFSFVLEHLEGESQSLLIYRLIVND